MQVVRAEQAAGDGVDIGDSACPAVEFGVGEMVIGADDGIDVDQAVVAEALRAARDLLAVGAELRVQGRR